MKKLLHFVNPVYNVNVLQSENGSVSASPISGNYGTEVTLTNTPDEGYVFDKYELTGATLYDGNKFKIKKSDVNVLGTFKRDLYEYANLGTQSWSSGGPSITLPTESEIPYNYIMFKQYVKLPRISAMHFGSNLYNRTISGSGTCIMGIRYKVTGWTTASGVTGIGSSSRDGYSSYYWSSWSNGSERLYRLIYELSTKRAHVYVGDTYLGYGSLSESLLQSTMSLNTYSETATPTFRNVRVVGGNSIEDLLAYTDGN